MKTTPYQEGDPSSSILTVVEAPAKWEMIKGRPLVGQSGQVYDELLHGAGLIRREIAIVNVCTEPIPSIEHLVSAKGHLTDAGLQVADRFWQRLAEGGYKPKVVIPMGNLALKVCTEKYGITKYRGSPAKCTKQDWWAIPTLHPASTLPGRGSYTDRYTIRNDIAKAKRIADQPTFEPPRRTLHIFPTELEVLKYLDFLESEWIGPIAFDIEIYNMQVSCISFAHDPLYSMCIPFVGHDWPLEVEMEYWRRIARLLANPSKVLVAHNAMFDVSFLFLQNNIRTKAKVHDTLIMSRILHPDFLSRLEFVSSIYTDEPYYKDDKQIWKRPEVDLERFYQYNAKDSAVTIEIYAKLHELIWKDVDYRWTYENTMSLFEPCLYMMARGMKLDIERLEGLRKRVSKEIEEKEAELRRISEVEFNFRSAAQCIKYFYGYKGYHQYTNRKTGRPTCDDKALARIVRRYNSQEARLVQELRSLDKLSSTYLELEYDPDRRLRCTYNIRGTTTGRLSSSKTIFGTGLNMQNLDPRLRDFITVG